MKRLSISLLLMPLAVQLAYAQNGKTDGQKTVIVVSKPMTYADSTNVKQLFFSALGEKNSGRFTQAADLFNKILSIDPSNDATLYELGKIKRNQNDETTAQGLF